ncbi:MarR family winged helix-turn-helix transcriptional regulator [Pseudonocardia sp.]|uniref:MarR family winged helix-turn-helix transcriptional regulator n=1 Tax=Pseudonocardia sp. TaxID=60912 RepID=UPI0031FBB157
MPEPPWPGRRPGDDVDERRAENARSGAMVGAMQSIGQTGRVADANRSRHAREVEGIMAAARVLVGVSAQSVAAIEDTVTLPQLRILVMVASRGPLNLGAVAAGLRVHPSNATRAVERLVVAGLLSRDDDPADRRNLQLRLTDAGRDLVATVMDSRRAAIAGILERMPARRRRTLAAALRSFADAGDEVSEDIVWSVGWTTTDG